jgi:hypothetical protein
MLTLVIAFFISVTLAAIYITEKNTIHTTSLERESGENGLGLCWGGGGGGANNKNTNEEGGGGGVKKMG